MIVLDIETTGLDPRRHSIVEIGAIDFNSPGNFFSERCSVWEGAEIDLNALEINGLSVDDIHDKTILTQKEIISKFIGWMDGIEDKTIAGQNVDFDIDFFNESSARCGLTFRLGKRKVDQHAIVYADMMKRNIKPPLKEGFSVVNSDFIMKYAGIPPEPKPHRAINGARFEAEALSRLIYGRGLFEEFEGFGVPEYLKQEIH